jgi:hypothetical protein
MQLGKCTTSDSRILERLYPYHSCGKEPISALRLRKVAVRFKNPKLPAFRRSTAGLGRRANKESQHHWRARSFEPTPYWACQSFTQTRVGRRSSLLRALLLRILHMVRSERLLMEQLNYNCCSAGL